MTFLVLLQRGRAILQKKRAAPVTNACGFPEKRSEGLFSSAGYCGTVVSAREVLKMVNVALLSRTQLDFLRTCGSSKLHTEDLFDLSRACLFRSVGHV
jgi:hypothetical protein